jgi:alkaline phosphatase D
MGQTRRVTTISRRDLIALGAATVAGASMARWTPAIAGARRPAGAGPFDGNPFALGVTSGDPDRTSAVLWTRLTRVDGGPLDEPDTTVTWELAEDEEFDHVAASGEAVARADEGHSVHVVAEMTGRFWFRFRTGEWTSPAGRVWSAPVTAAELRVAAASCQHFETGYYAAHRDIAEWSPDLVLFLGDFIYEYGANPVGGENLRSHGTPKLATLGEYRDRYALYLSDADLRSSRAVSPWVVIWDDHEVENNYAGPVPEDVGEIADFGARRLAAYQAWWEHMPVRMERPTASDDFTIYRSLAWGDLANLIMLDGRQYRTNQACGDAVLSLDPPCPTAAAPERTMLGDDQEQWLAGEIAATTATWPVIGQQTVMTEIRLNGAILNYDQWDGYSPARERLLAAAGAAERAIVLTGDIHLAGVGVLPGVGVEFVATSISSRGQVPVELEDTVAALGDIYAAELGHRGYTRHVIRDDGWEAEYRIVDDVTAADSPVSTWRTFFVDPLERDTVFEYA